MKFSIIVPVYKVEKYIDRCVESLIGQTYRDIEIILVDDGSPDTCPEICDKYAALDSRVRVIHKENGGLSDARNYGIDAASGEYVMFVDSDDYIELDACERLLPFTEGGSDVIIGDAVAETENGSSIISHVSDIVGVAMSGCEFLRFSVLAEKDSMAAVLNIIRRDYLNENSLRFKKGILHEDERFTPELLLCAKSVIYTGEVFYHYLIRENSITTSRDFRRNATDFYTTCQELSEIYKNIEDRKFRAALLNSLARKYLHIFQVGALYRYGREYAHKRFILKNARGVKMMAKAWLFAISPKLYYKINCHSKKKK